MREKIIGITSCARQAPMLAHPAATPLARPTMDPENIGLIQNWFATKFASEKPIRNRSKTKD